MSKETITRQQKRCLRTEDYLDYNVEEGLGPLQTAD